MFTATTKIDYKNTVLFFTKTTYNIYKYKYPKVFLYYFIYICVCLRKFYFTAVEESVMNCSSAYITSKHL